MRKTGFLISILVLFGCPGAGRSRADKVETVGCLSTKSGQLKLTDEDGNVYSLVGQTASLASQIGDQLRVSGVQEHPPTRPTEHSAPETTLRVTRVESLLHANPDGVRPALGDVATWEDYTDRKYGVRFRYPRTFKHSDDQIPGDDSNFVDRDRAAAVLLESRRVPLDTYSNSNFLGGSFNASVDSNIRGNGTCRQFRSFWPERTSTRLVHGIEYAQTLAVEGAAAQASSLYWFHTFRNGLCYEFTFVFDEQNGTGMTLPCSIQWVLERNEFELMDAILSGISFTKPAVGYVGDVPKK
jgi:hypothetical protein